jgi:hypothetical protein
MRRQLDLKWSHMPGEMGNTAIAYGYARRTALNRQRVKAANGRRHMEIRRWSIHHRAAWP